MRLIDANDVKKRADCYTYEVRSVVTNILKHTKTVSDAVTVVRCKDCEWFDGQEYCYENGLFVGLDLSFFCAKGKRRSE